MGFSTYWNNFSWQRERKNVGGEAFLLTYSGVGPKGRGERVGLRDFSGQIPKVKSNSLLYKPLESKSTPVSH